MADVLNGAAGREAEERERLVATARLAARGAISAETIAAAQEALAAVQAPDGKPAKTEPARDLAALRGDPVLRNRLDQDVTLAGALALRLIADALWLGYRIGALGRSAGLPLEVELDDSDRRDLVGYPVNGYTAAEIAGDLAYLLRREADRALALPLTGPIDPKAIPPVLGQVSLAHVERVARAVDEAHAAGVGAAVRAIGAALTGAA